MAGSNNSLVLAIVGPTASGKSDLALRVAAQLGAEIISADSRQIYRFLDIGTAKPTAIERASVPHHFLDILDPGEDYNAGAYGVDARRKIADILSEGKRVVLAGGSGLYLRAAIDGLFDGPTKNVKIRSILEDRLQIEGAASLLEELRRIDPEAAAGMTPSNTRRIIRALEVFSVTGKTISDHHRTQETIAPFRFVQVALRWPRELLYERINRRVLSMLDQGLMEEVRSLQQRGFGLQMNALNTVGYKEAFAFLQGSISEQEMIRLIQQNTRRFAKRQLTWFRADHRISWIDVDANNSAAQILEKTLDFVRLEHPKNR